MSINTIMGVGLSALTANQRALQATSTNVSNLNTVGYSRLDVTFQSKSAGGLHGVDVEITRVANAFLAAAEKRAAADAASVGVRADLLDRAQALLGDPSSSDTVFAALDPVFRSFGALSVDPSSTLRRSEALAGVDSLLSQINALSREFSALRDEAHARAGGLMSEAGSLMSGIAQLNASIQRATVAGVSASEAQTEQARLLDRLAEIVDIRVQPRANGGVEVRTTNGLLLVDQDAASFSFGSGAAGEIYPSVQVTQPRSTTPVPLDRYIAGGELQGALKARDRDLVDLQLSFGEFAAGVADSLNAAHNAASAVPAPTSLTGRNTGLIATDRLNFSGSTNLAITTSSGAVVRNLRIDFNAGTITDEVGAVTGFANSVGDLETALGSALGADATVDFSAGRLSITANGAGAGVVLTDDPTTPARRAGMGFSHFFGLNDLVQRNAPVVYATGLSGLDLHGFTPGEQVTFAVRNADGAVINRINFTVGTGATISTLRADIDAALAGYGQTTFDATGRLGLQPTNANAARIDIISDTARRGDTGLSLAQVFGLGEAVPSSRGVGLALRSDMIQDPRRLSLAQADLAGVVAGATVLSVGDSRGALKLEASGSQARVFAAAGDLSAQSASLADYGARIAGHFGGRAESLERARTASLAVQTEVKERRTSEEGVNLDEELIKMTTYQQAYAASSRLIQAARDLYDVLLRMV